MILEELKKRLENPPALAEIREVYVRMQGRFGEKIDLTIADIKFNNATGATLLIVDQSLNDIDLW